MSISVPIAQRWTTDKWILSSAVQKSIRRGRPLDAARFARYLNRLDPAYLRRRLPVVALEDVGIGDESACLQTLELCADASRWRGDADRVSTQIVELLAKALKSRAACDALCALEVHPDRVRLARAASVMTPTAIGDLLGDVRQPISLRAFGAAALFHTSFTGDQAERSRVLDHVSKKLGFSGDRRELIRHRSRTANMSSMLVLLPETSGIDRIETRDFPHAFEIVAGLPLCSLDQYTRAGKLLIGRYARACRPIASFLRAIGAGAGAINLALFQAESSLLNVQVSRVPDQCPRGCLPHPRCRPTAGSCRA